MTRPAGFVQINQLHEEEQDAGRELHTTPTGGTADAAGIGGRVVGEKVLCETEEIRVVPLNSRYDHSNTILLC